jgi:F-type H+-transporting ATPase subunit a
MNLQSICNLFLFSFLFYRMFFLGTINQNRFFYFHNLCINVVYKIFKSQEKLTNTSFILRTLFLLLFMFNITGLIPMGISLTTQLMIIFPLAIISWRSCFVSNLLFSYKNFFSRLIPKGVTLVLSPVLSIVELVRHLLRPITLAVRLVANITVGHVVLALIIITFFSNIFSSLVLSLTILMVWLGYSLVEGAIALIQGGVFSMLNLLYSTEHL